MPEVVAGRPERVPHNLLVHLDSTDETLEIRYSYPFTQPHALPEQVVTIQSHDIPEAVSRELDFIRTALLAQLSAAEPVHLPSRDLQVERNPGILTVVIADATRTLPVARLYVHERVPALGSQREIELRLDPGNWSPPQFAAWRRLEKAVGGIVWTDYGAKVPSTSSL